MNEVDKLILRFPDKSTFRDKYSRANSEPRELLNNIVKRIQSELPEVELYITDSPDIRLQCKDNEDKGVLCGRLSFNIQKKPYVTLYLWGIKRPLENSSLNFSLTKGVSSDSKITINSEEELDDAFNYLQKSIASKIGGNLNEIERLMDKFPKKKFKSKYTGSCYQTKKLLNALVRETRKDFPTVEIKLIDLPDVRIFQRKKTLKANKDGKAKDVLCARFEFNKEKQPYVSVHLFGIETPLPGGTLDFQKDYDGVSTTSKIKINKEGDIKEALRYIRHSIDYKVCS